MIQLAEPAPVATLSVDELKEEAVGLKLAIDKGENTMREWRIRLGQVLTEIQQRVGHGKWLPYVEKHLEIGNDQVANYQKLAANSERVRNLPVGLSMREELKALRDELREPRALPEPGSVELKEREGLLRFCQDLDTATIVALILDVMFLDAETALDATYGNGAFWNGSQRVRVTAHDVNPQRALHGVVDFRDLPYDDESFDVVTLDPPHLADSSAGSIMGDRFGTVPDANLQTMLCEGARECWRVARLGVVIKLTDHIHGQRFQRETGWVISAIGQEPYDVVHQVRSGALVDPKWEEQLSARNNGSSYLIFRKGDQRHVER